MVLDSLKEVCLACVARLRTAVACRVLNSLADVAPVPRSLRHSFIPGAHVLLSGCGQEQRAEGTVHAPVSSLPAGLHSSRSHTPAPHSPATEGPPPSPLVPFQPLLPRHAHGCGVGWPAPILDAAVCVLAPGCVGAVRRFAGALLRLVAWQPVASAHPDDAPHVTSRSSRGALMSSTSPSPWC